MFGLALMGAVILARASYFVEARLRGSGSAHTIRVRRLLSMARRTTERMNTPHRYSLARSLSTLLFLLAPTFARAADEAPDVAGAQQAVARGDDRAALALVSGELLGDVRAVPLLNELAIAAAGKGRLEEAVVRLEAALATAPGYQQVYENLHAVRRALALQAYRRSLDLPVSNAPPPPLASIPADARLLPPLPVGDAVVAPFDPGAPERFVAAWAAAWAAQDADGYLAAYAPGYFDPATGSRADWERLRRERVTSPAFIEIALEAVEVRRFGRDGAVVEFQQRYRSNTFSDRTTKVLVLRAGPDGWRIQREYAVR